MIEGLGTRRSHWRGTGAVGLALEPLAWCLFSDGERLRQTGGAPSLPFQTQRQKEFLIDNLLVRVHHID